MYTNGNGLTNGLRAGALNSANFSHEGKDFMTFCDKKKYRLTP